MQLSPYQLLFVRQEQFNGHALGNNLEGRAVFKGSLDFNKLKNAIEAVLKTAEWTKLSIDMAKACWENTSILNGSFEYGEATTLPPAYSNPLRADGKLWAIALLKTDSGALLYVKFHHALADAHSFALFWEACRKAYCEGNVEPLSCDFSVATTAFSEKTLESTPLLEHIGSGAIRRFNYHFSAKWVNALKARAQERAVDFQSLLLFALQKQLQEIEQEIGQSLHVGIPLRNRPSKAAKNNFLCSINFLPLSQQRFESIEKLTLDLRQVFRQQAFPLLQWLSAQQKERAFNVLFSYQKESYRNDWGEQMSCQVEFLPTAIDENVWGLHLLEYEGDDGLTLAMDIRQDLHSSYYWKKCFDNFIKDLLHWYFYHHWNRKRKLPIAALQGKMPLIEDFWAPYLSAAGTKAALICSDVQYSFEELRQKVTARASMLAVLSANDIAIVPERKADTIINIIALWQLGKCIYFDSNAEALPLETPPEAYTITYPNWVYRAKTSGTSGKGKEVRIGSKGLLALRADWQLCYGSHDKSIHLSLADMRFDVFMGDLFRSILSGQTLVLPNEEEKLSPTHILQFIKNYKVTQLETTPSVLPLFLKGLSQCPNLEVLICGSEPMSKAISSEIFQQLAPHTKLFNSYGLTETSIDSACFEIPRTWEEDFIPAGMPLGAQQLEIRIRENLAPIGIWGELWISGDAVGYPIGEFDHFLTLPTGLRAYKTGDKAMILPQKGLVLAGRLSEDFIKINGRRIPAQDILKKLDNEWGLTMTALFVVETQAVLFVPESCDINGLNAFLQHHFSPYQLPDRIVAVQHWPLNINGKTDRKALIASLSTQGEASKWQATNEQEQILEACLLEIGKAYGSLEQSLFHWGWNSIDLLRLTNALGQRGVFLAANELLNKPYLSTVLQHLKSVQEIKNQDNITLSNDDLDDILSVLNN